MPTFVEQAIYRLPKHDRYGTYLDKSFNTKRDITKDHYGRHTDFGELLDIAEDIGLRSFDNMPTRRGTWHIYEGSDLAIPNFPEGHTNINESLALYERDGQLTSALLRIQPGSVSEPFTPEEVMDDLDVFTKYYVERPRLLGFPSEALSTDKTHISIFFVGIPTGAAVAYLLSGGDIRSVGAGALLGETVPAATSATLWWLSERRARGKIPNKDEYIVGDSAREVLEKQQGHIIRVSIQRELYSALKKTGSTLTPEQFLKDIYQQIPSALIDRRQKEMEMAKYPSKYTENLTPEALPKMVGVAQILQTA